MHVAPRVPTSNLDTLPASEASGQLLAAPTVRELESEDGETGRRPSGKRVVRPPGEGDTRATVDPRRFAIVKELARGGMGRVSIAEDRALGRPVALKEVIGDAPDLVARFERELALTARLQHPGIVTIHDGGRWPTGEPVYVMRLVDGESLERKILGCTTLAQRIALLPHAIAAIDALSYAHAQGIIHRDLKPANVMIGDYGETVVIDWGLAKDLRAPAEAKDAGFGTGTSSSSGATVAGEVIGTPAYMPPEQARGVDVDERADVYALGALLYHVLAGAPPFRGSADYVIDAVISGPPPSLAELVPDLPPDLLAIVTRAMATSADQRYASAAELGAELKRFQRGKLVASHQYTAWELAKRWLRRRRAVVAVATVAVVVLAVGAVISVRRIVHEERRVSRALRLAEANRAEAVKRGEDTARLLDFLIFKLYDKLEPVGRLDVLDDVATMLREHYSSRDDAVVGPEELRRRARARANLGAVLRNKGDSSAALVEYRAAEAILSGLESQLTEPELGVALVAYKVAIGQLLAARGNDDAAVAVAHEALALTERGLASTRSTSWLRAKVSAQLLLGQALEERRELTAALASYHAACATAQELAAIENNRDSKRTMSRCHDNVGDVLVARADYPAALVEYRAALSIDAALLGAEPDDISLTSDVRFDYQKNGDALAGIGDTKGALAMYRSALDIARSLVTRDPENAIWRREQSVTHVRIGDVLSTPETLHEAIAAFRAAQTIRRDLVARDPSNADWKRDLLIVEAKLGTMLEASGQLVDALTAYDAARVIGEARLALPGNRLAGQRDLLLPMSGLGRVHATRGDLAQALRWHRAELAGAEQVLAGAGRDAVPADYWAVVLAQEAIGTLLERQRDHAGAEAIYAAALGIAQKRVVEDAQDPEWGRMRDQLQTSLARVRKR
jgi:tetratricopeptide (TPR) repeat protein